MDEAIFDVVDAIPAEPVGGGTEREDELVVVERGARGEVDRLRIRVVVDDPVTQQGDALLGVHLALVGLEVATGHAVHKGVHEGCAREEVVCLSADDRDLGMGITLPRRHGAGHTGDAVSNDDNLHGAPAGRREPAVSASVCSMPEQREGGNLLTAVKIPSAL